jgi:hypothetical protein
MSGRFAAAAVGAGELALLKTAGSVATTAFARASGSGRIEDPAPLCSCSFGKFFGATAENAEAGGKGIV